MVAYYTCYFCDHLFQWHFWSALVTISMTFFSEQSQIYVVFYLLVILIII